MPAETGAVTGSIGGVTEDPEEHPHIFEASVSQLRRRDLDFRAKYLGRLSYSGAWAPREHRPPRHQTVTIFDWDDTLLCTSFISLYPSSNIRPQLRAVSALAHQLLMLAVRSGPTFIVTNAVDGWVQYSAHKFLPELRTILQKVRIISARSRFEPHFPDCIAEWKVQALLEVQQQLDSRAIANLISVGDSEFEMDAVRTMGRQFEEAVVKTVKLWERPSPEDLRKQLQLVLKDFRRILEHPADVKIGFEKKKFETTSDEPLSDDVVISARVAGA